MSNDLNITTTPVPVFTTISPNTSTSIPLEVDEINTSNVFSIIHSVFTFIMSRFFLLFFGIFIGIGIVVKFSPESNNLKEQIKILNEENNKLKNLINKNTTNSNWGDIKNSIILKK